MLEVENVTVQFGGLTAVKGMDLHVNEGEIHSLIGPNGAGKTTLFNVITRVIQQTAGTVRFCGECISADTPESIIHRGVSRTFQNLQLFQGMTIYENIYAGYVHRYGGGVFSLFTQRPDGFKEAVNERVLETAELFGISGMLNLYPAQLSYGVLKRIEISRALISKPKLLLLDEPAAGLNHEETEELNTILCSINKGRGLTILLVEHDMDLVMRISDRITVMDFGEKIAEGRAKEISENKEVIRVYLGEDDADAGNQ